MRALLAAAGALACCAWPALGAQAAPTAAATALSAATTELAAAREEREAAYAAVEALVHELRDDYLALTTGAQSSAHQHALVLAMQDSLQTAATRLAAEAAKGRALLRGTRRSILEQAFAEPVAAAAPVDARLCGWVATRVAEQLAAREDFDGITGDQLLGQVKALFPAGMTWYEFWNHGFHDQLAETGRLRAANLAYEAAGLALERLRHPERYGSKGEVAPPGMVIIPGGSYELGPNTGWERPSRRVTLKVFAIDRHEVTNGQYALFVNSLPVGQRAVNLPRGWMLDEQSLAQHPAERRDHPVLHIDWHKAAAYAAWAGKRLPTEDEWEAAAGGIARRVYPWGDEYRIGMAQGGEAGEEAAESMPVESFPHAPSPTGCFDMAGNAWEWTATLEDGTDIETLPEGLVNVVIRGGGFSSRREELATRYRWTAPGHDAFSSPRYTRPIGFRCVADLP